MIPQQAVKESNNSNKSKKKKKLTMDDIFLLFPFLSD